MKIKNTSLSKTSHAVLTAFLVMGSAGSAQAGAFVFAAPSRPDVVAHPAGYFGNGGTLDVEVCIVPNTPNASNMEQSIRNNIAVWNKQQSTTSNLRNFNFGANGTFDFESVALHELGHCVGLAHPNLGSQPGVSGSNTNFTQSLPATNGFNFNAGADTVIGSADDVRADDINLHFFNIGTNNPFAENNIVDSTTYTRDTAMLPTDDLFPANGDRSVSSLARYSSPFTEASMQQGTFNDEVQRTLGHDDVSTLRFGKSGLDRQQGTSDDYTINLTYGGISDAESCDITVAMDAAETGFAVCQLGGQFLVTNSHIRISSARIFFNPNSDWFFNQSPPCNESVALTANVWKMISLPCQVGISTSATVASVFGDDLGVGNYDTTWRMYVFEYTDQGGGNFSGAYRKLETSDELKDGVGYWIITTQGQTVDVQGEYNSQVDSDVFVEAANMNNFGWNLVGMPFRNSTAWADTKIIDNDGSVLTLSQADPADAGGPGPGVSGTACTATPLPAADCKVRQFAYKYNGTSNSYDVLSTSAGTLDAFDAAWVYAGGSDYSVRIPMSNTERTSP